jgi:hypothetical protein
MSYSKSDNRKDNAGIGREISIVDEIDNDVLCGLTALHVINCFIPVAVVVDITHDERCTEQSDINIAVVSNVTRSRLYEAKTYREFKKNLYGIDFEQYYDILQFNSIEKIKNSRDFVFKDIISYGKLLYKGEGVQYV